MVVASRIDGFAFNVETLLPVFFFCMHESWKKMAAKRKAGSLELSNPSASSGRKPKAITLDESVAEALIDRVSKGVLERLKSEVAAAVDVHIERAIREIRAVFEEHVLQVEKTCSAIVESLEFTNGKMQEQNKELSRRVCELMNALTHLEHQLYRVEHEGNLVVSGVGECCKEGSEDTKSVFMSLAHDTLGLELRPDDIIEAVRLGRQTLNSGRGNSPPSHRRPRSILIRTTGKAAQRKIMACRAPKLKPYGIFLRGYVTGTGT